ncbi:MAG: hypothetical protein K0U68_11145 [Gammaproteobacteria bacterium]|nr:hypothetical protein [Gammaproteobacteria bacterium]
MKTILLIQFFILIAMTGCGKNSTTQADIPNDKVYNVVFEGHPEITDDRLMSASGQIGEILKQTPVGEDNTVAKISVKEEYTDSIRSNTVFVVTDGHLQTDAFGEAGQPAEEGDRLLGFTSKAKLLWFKTKSKVTGLSQAAKNKAELLYNKVTN